MLPSTIIDVLAQQQGIPRDDGLLLYGLDDVEERNATFEVADYLPGYLLIGDDSGGRGILVALTSTAHPVYACGLGAMNEEDVVPLADSLQAWAQEGCPLPD
jgi:hypothetical protein